MRRVGLLRVGVLRRVGVLVRVLPVAPLLDPVLLRVLLLVGGLLVDVEEPP